MSDIVATTSIDWRMVSWFADQGIPPNTLARMATLRIARGTRASDGYLDENQEGQAFLAFYEDTAQDVVFWAPLTNEFATLRGRAFALGEGNIRDATTFHFDNHLHIHADALTWLRDDGRGIVVVDWLCAFDRLRDAPRIAISERLLPTYREAMRLTRLPELSVLAPAVRLAP